MASPPFPLDVAMVSVLYRVTLMLETVSYGVFIPLFAASIYFLRAGKTRVNKAVLCTSIVMFMLATVHFVLRTYRDISFSKSGLTASDAVAEIFSKAGTASFVLSGIYVTQTLVGDFFMWYRVATVWNNNKRVVIPTGILIIASLAVGIVTLYEFGQMNSSNVQDAFLILFPLLTLITNLLCGALIIARIWKLHTRSASPTSARSKTLRAIAIVVEAGAAYIVLLVCFLASAACIVSRNYTVETLLFGGLVQSVLVQAIGIIFSLIIIRVATGLSSTTTQGSNTWALTTVPPPVVQTVDSFDASMYRISSSPSK